MPPWWSVCSVTSLSYINILKGPTQHQCGNGHPFQVPPLPQQPVPPNPLGSGFFPQNSLETSLKQLINILPLVKSPWSCLIVFCPGSLFSSGTLMLLFSRTFPPWVLPFSVFLPVSLLIFLLLDCFQGFICRPYLFSLSPFQLGQLIHRCNKVLEQKRTLAIILSASFCKWLRLWPLHG